MVSKLLSSNPFKTFYIVFAYILAFSVWWAYLLYDKNELAYLETIELNQIKYQQLHPGTDYSLIDEYLKIQSKYERQKLMILTEGSVFIALLLLGLLRVRKVFIREIELVMQQHNFILSITHELKSPLSTVKLSLQTLGKRKLEAEQQERLIGNSLVDLDRLEGLVDNILFAAKIESGQSGFAAEHTNVSELTHQVAERFIMNKKKIIIEDDIAPDVYLLTDSIGFISVVTNLIENAVKYSPEGSLVRVILQENAAEVVLQVVDSGYGISAADKKKIFDKFYRIGDENTRNTKGTGLGLYIVKRVVEIYRGTIEVLDNSPQGTIFKLKFMKTTR